MRFLCALAFLTLAACGDDGPVDVAGTYALNFTSGANGCELDGWTTGATATNIQVDLVQTSGSPEVTGTVQGVVGIYLSVILKTNQLSGRVSGRDIDVLLTSLGEPLVMGQCSFRYQLHLSGELNGDILTGTLDITTVTNGSPDCGNKEDCHSLETFNGSRPPSTARTATAN